MDISAWLKSQMEAERSILAAARVGWRCIRVKITIDALWVAVYDCDSDSIYMENM